MADLVITASAVVPGSNAVIASGTAGVTITAGQPVYADATDSNKIKLADGSSAGSVAKANAVGIAINGASLNQPIDYIVSGDLAMNAAMVKRTVYVLGSAAGKIAPTLDLTAGEYGTVVGISSSTTNLKVGINASGVTEV